MYYLSDELHTVQQSDRFKLFFLKINNENNDENLSSVVKNEFLKLFIPSFRGKHYSEIVLDMRWNVAMVGFKLKIG